MLQPQAKGVNFRGFIGAARRLCGPDIIERMLPHLSPELGRQLQRDAFVTNSWYPVAELVQLHRALHLVTGKGDELSRAVGRDSSRDDFSGIYRVLTFVLSPELLMRRTPSIWQRYYNMGMVAVEARSGFGEARFTGVSGFSHHVWSALVGGSQGILEACGAKNVKMTMVGGGGDNDTHMTVTAEWT